jgi:NHLM bacteriocin system ABC transporter peptidase/ATP-binding protein
VSEAAPAVAPEPEAEAPKPSGPPNRRAKTPTVIQMEGVECGAASLAMILAYYGRIAPLEELRVECGVSRDGSKANNVLKAARKFGLEAKGFKHEIDQLYPLKFPCILFWNANHFLVLEGFKGGKVYLNDPAQGPRVVTMEEFDASYSGVVLTFDKGPEFKPGGDKPSMFHALRRRLVGSELALLFVMICGLFLVVPGLVIPTFSRVFVDEYLGNGRDIIRPLMLGMAITAILNMALVGLQQYALLRLETKLALKTSARFFTHVLRLPVHYFAQRFAGEIGSRVAINDRVASMVGGKLATTVIDCILVAFYGVLMFLYDALLTSVVIGLALLNIAAMKAVQRVRVDASRRLQADKGKLIGTAMYGLRMIETLKATGSEPEFFARWSGYQAKSLRAEQDMQLLSEMIAVVPTLVNTMVTASVLLIGGLRVMDGVLTVGMLVAYQTLSGQFTQPLTNLVNFGGDLQELEADMNRLDDVLRYPADKTYAREEVAEDKRLKLQGKVELRNVTFGYSPLEKPLIEDFNLTIQPGQRVALVGASGSGKSTVAKVVSGLYEPWRGEVLFDDVARPALPRRLLTNSLGMVDQDIFMFDGSVSENITMWDGTIPVSSVATAARDAAIDEVIESREGAYTANVTEGGSNFSGGQRQRLEIARALVGNPTVLILDEATSALDPSTEVVIDDSTRRRGCTTIIIAHRLSTIRDADEIIVLERGKIVQRGTHEEMKEADGPYARLISAH